MMNSGDQSGMSYLRLNLPPAVVMDNDAVDPAQ